MIFCNGKIRPMRKINASYNQWLTAFHHLQPMKNKKYLILCEGMTEKGFFDAFVDEYRLNDFVEVRQLIQTPVQLPQTVKNLLPCYSRIALVYDHDNQKEFASIFAELAKNPEIILADSNPCFEVFFLSCHKHQSEHPKLKPMTEAGLPQQQILDLLRAHDPFYSKGYEAGKRLFRTYQSTLDRGIANQRSLRKSPYSHLGRLIDDLRLMQRFIRVSAPPHPDSYRFSVD